MLSMLPVEFRVGMGMARPDDVQQQSRKSRTALDRGNSLIFIIVIPNIFV